MRWSLFPILLAGLLLTAAARAATPEIIDGVAAVVNEKVITYSDVREYVQPVEMQLRRNFEGAELVKKIKAAQLDALNNLIERNLILQEFKEKGYSFPETVVDGEMNDIIANDFGGDRAAFIKTLEAENITLSRYRDQLRDRIIVQAMRNRKTQNEVVVSPYKIETYYKTHLDDYKEEDQIQLRMIYIKKSKEPAPAPAPSPISAQVTNDVVAGFTNMAGVVTNATALPVTNEVVSATTNAVSASVAPPIDPRRRMAEEILAKLDAGDSFDSLARVYSDGKEGKDGGEWGWVKRDELRKDLSEPAFKLKRGAHSGLIETAEGYYLLQVDDVKPAHNRSLAEVRDEIEKILLQQQRLKMQEEWVKQLRAKAYIRMF